MNIKRIEIEGIESNITISRTDAGARATVSRFTRRDGLHDHIIAEFGRDEPREARYTKAQEVARYIYGQDRRGRAAATNSMIHDVLDEIERLADC